MRMRCYGPWNVDRAVCACVRKWGVGVQSTESGVTEAHYALAKVSPAVSRALFPSWIPIWNSVGFRSLSHTLFGVSAWG